MYTVKTEQFEGPFELLLHLIEKEKLDITEISLTKVTDEFLGYLSRIDEARAEELANFLEIAAKLLLIKSRLLIPGAFEDEEGGEDLVKQLKIYREFLQASKKISRIANSPKYAFAREKIPLKIVPGLTLDIRVTPAILERYFRNILNIAISQMNLTRRTIRRRVISLKGKIDELLKLIRKRREIILNHFMGQKKRTEKVVMFLAVLELVKKQIIIVSQKGLFENIIVKKV